MRRVIEQASDWDRCRGAGRYMRGRTAGTADRGPLDVARADQPVARARRSVDSGQRRSSRAGTAASPSRAPSSAAGHRRVGVGVAARRWPARPGRARVRFVLGRTRARSPRSERHPRPGAVTGQLLPPLQRHPAHGLQQLGRRLVVAERLDHIGEEVAVSLQQRAAATFTATAPQAQRSSGCVARAVWRSR